MKKSNGSIITEIIADNEVKIARATSKMKTADAESYVCVWKKFALTVCTVQKSNGVKAAKYGVSSDSLYPEVFEKHIADNICRIVRNGNGDYPEVMSLPEYYKLVADFFTMSNEEMKGMWNKMASEI